MLEAVGMAEINKIFAVTDALGVTPHLLSQLLNLHLRRSFFQFVNAYRADDLAAAQVDSGKNDERRLDHKLFLK